MWCNDGASNDGVVAASYVVGGVELVELLDRLAVQLAREVAVVLRQRFAGLEARVRLRLVVLVLVVVLGGGPLARQLGGRQRLLLAPTERLFREQTELGVHRQPTSSLADDHLSHAATSQHCTAVHCSHRQAVELSL